MCKRVVRTLADEKAIDFDNDFINLKDKKFNVVLSNPPYFLLKINKK